MKRERLVYGILTFIFVSLFITQPALLNHIEDRFLRSPDFGDVAIEKLQAENDVLKAEHARFEDVASELGSFPKEGILADVYSRYPFSLKHELLVNAGTLRGVAVGDAAAFAGVLVGEVREVFRDSALVRTVLDERWTSAVRIGTRGVDALLVGGAEPRLTLIVKDANVKTGDIVYNAAPAFPLGMPVGRIAHIMLSSDGLFQEATLGVGYDVSRIHSVSIVGKPSMKQP